MSGWEIFVNLRHEIIFSKSCGGDGALFSCRSDAGSAPREINFGDFSNWVTRDIKESAVLGGKVKTVYAIGPAKHIRGNVPYTNQGGSPWATSNVYAKVSGVVKASNTVSPAMVGGSRMAKLSTKMEEVKVLGIINLDVMVPGTIFLGTVREPISSTSDPYRNSPWESRIRSVPRRCLRHPGRHAECQHPYQVHRIRPEEDS